MTADAAASVRINAPSQGLLTLAWRLDDEREAQERLKHDVEYVEATKGPAEAFEPAK